jgi:hypothetical protein
MKRPKNIHNLSLSEFVTNYNSNQQNIQKQCIPLTIEYINDQKHWNPNKMLLITIVIVSTFHNF